MSSSDIALSVRGLSKSYSIGAVREEKHSTLAESLLARACSAFRRVPEKTFKALDDISFEIQKGDVVGIIGRNGAGKSTLLKILSRITEPSSGEIDLYGRIGSLLEVGTGFHPELTGRENIYLNGAILGMRREEITRHFDAIVDFSGVEQFLDTPVKRYSSGMYVRLAFAVAAHLESEILVVDEVLAVGDAEFQRKCIGKMKDVATGGRTVLFVSHHMQSVQVLCNRGMYLENGTVKHFGGIPEAIDHYVGSYARTTQTASDPDRRPGTGEFRFTRVTPAKEVFTCGEEKTVEYTIARRKPFAGKLFLSAHIVNEVGVTIAQCDSRMTGVWVESDDLFNGCFRFRTPWLKPGRYRVELYICSAGVVDGFEEACHLEVIPLLPYRHCKRRSDRGGDCFCGLCVHTRVNISSLEISTHLSTLFVNQEICFVCGCLSHSVRSERDGFSLLECHSCRVVRTAPSTYVTHGSYDANPVLASGYEAKRVLSQYYADILLATLAPHKKGQRLLDVGCSVGALMQSAARLGYLVEGIDLDANAIEFARK